MPLIIRVAAKLSLSVGEVVNAPWFTSRCSRCWNHTTSGLNFLHGWWLKSKYNSIVLHYSYSCPPSPSGELDQWRSPIGQQPSPSRPQRQQQQQQQQPGPTITIIRRLFYKSRECERAPGGVFTRRRRAALHPGTSWRRSLRPHT